MAFDLSNLKAELDAVVNEATNIADLVTKYADVFSRFAGAVPGGAQAETVVRVLDDLDKALHEAKSILGVI